MHYLFVLTLLLAPAYAVRFDLFGLPTNLLMVWLFLLWLFFASWLFIGHRMSDFVHWFRSELVTYHLSLVTLFLLAGLISLFVGGLSQEKLGQFIVLFLQPVAIFVIFRYLLSIKHLALNTRNWFLVSCYLLLAISGLYAIIQYFTLLGVPEAWWGNAQEPKRAVAFFLHPNFYALFVTPLLAFLVPFVRNSIFVRHSDPDATSGEESRSFISSKATRFRMTSKSIFISTLWILGATGLLLSLSRGGWLGLATAIGVYVLVAGNRKIIKSALIAGALIVLIVIVVPNLRYRVLLPFRGEKSSVARLSLWDTGWKMVKDSPVAGKGLLGFSNNWYAYNTDQNLDHYPAPHNIALNFWVDTGLLGLLSFFGLLGLAIWRGLRNKEDAVRLGLTLACIAIIVHGLVDIPYFKNDLALLFWMLFAFI